MDEVRVRRWTGEPGSWETAVRAPHPGLRGRVATYRGYRLDLREPRQRLEAPAGVATMVLQWEGALWLRGATRPEAPAVVAGSLVSGLHATATLGGHHGRLHGVEVVLGPLAGFQLFGVPMSELTDRTQRADDVHRAARLTPAREKR